MSYVKFAVSVPYVPDDALLFYDASLNEYYVLVDSLGNYITM